MHPLWFRLDDVLPLAEHAMSCPTHRITGAQAHAAAPTGPALVWTSSPVMDLLTSNGVPAWYGEHGTVHAAEAYTWRDTSGRYGVSRRRPDDTGYLPLTRPDGSPSPVLDLLRSARHNAHSWITIDIGPAADRLITADHVHAVTGRHDLVPAGTTWSPAEVTCPSVDYQPYPALVADAYTTDAGDLLARFHRTTIARMTADLRALHANPDADTDPMPGEYPVLWLDRDVLTVAEHGDGQQSSRITDHLTPDDDGYYPLGAYLWPWQHADPTQPYRP
ncbi:hypothetical protein AB0M20_33395 [Actinoplanes sp. NPDC051633]|uniref:hypothetical protein n=1 Tax=Actinoplanes sp. NPDC051633 TaxID=3155670 RepID=UPI00344AF670